MCTLRGSGGHALEFFIESENETECKMISTFIRIGTIICLTTVLR